MTDSKTKKPTAKKTPSADSHSSDVLVACVLDRSGSMAVIWNDTVGGLNTLKQQQAEEGKRLRATTLFTLTAFDTQYDIVYEGWDAENVPDLAVNDAKVYPRGGTALYDAIGRTIKSVEATPDLPEKVVFVILTDGQENSSREFTQKQVFDLIDAKTKKGWQFVYIGADKAAYDAAANMGIMAGSVVTGTHSGKTSAMSYASVSANTSVYRGGRKADMTFTSVQKSGIEKQDDDKKKGSKR